MLPRIRIGNQTNCNVMPVSASHDFALAQGFDAFEWFSDKGRAGWCEDDCGPVARRRLRQTSREHDLLFSVHVPWAANPLEPSGAEAIRRSLDFAGDVGAGVVNIHLFMERGAEAFVAAVHPLLVYAHNVGVRLSVENTPSHSPDDFNAVFGLLAGIPEAAGRVGMCLDMGHANLFPGTHHDYLAYVDRLGPQVPVIHWHAHENWGDRDSHLTLFTGPSAQYGDAGVRGLVERLLKRGFAGSVVLEQWPDPPDLLVQARDRLRRIFETISF